MRIMLIHSHLTISKNRHIICEVQEFFQDWHVLLGEMPSGPPFGREQRKEYLSRQIKLKNMARPATRQQLISAATDNFDKLTAFIASMTKEELDTPFDFSADTKKKEAHWKRDKNLRDVIMHLVSWQDLLLKWVESNMNGTETQFLLPGYTWKTYGDMNILFWEKCQDIALDDAMNRLNYNHRRILDLAESFTDKELFTKAHYTWTGTTSLGSYFISTTSAHYDWALKKLKAHRKNIKR